MGSFGTAVASLVDTYTKCLSLLKGARNREAGVSSETRSTLSTSLRSDRARVRRAYASRLSQDGSRFEKGDTPARSALRRIVKKLTTALAEVVHSSHGRKGQAINYETLAALSNGSSSDAIRAMSDLSSRVGSTTSTVNSTKLGEIRHRLSKQRPIEEFENKVAYPLYAYHTEEVPVRKKWWNPFRRQ
ncbi:hypothetical protein FAVG1_06316 [Fusarium avenaceum]|nr:hypothetical protein FAVG1_06316 [Fusarium avenaceum]